MTSGDPYRDWLAIKQASRPLTHYELLRLRPLESDSQVIRAAAERQVQRLSRADSGGQKDVVSRLLQELAAARACLLDPVQKGAYDSALATAAARSGPSAQVKSTTTPTPATESLGDGRKAVPLLPPRALTPDRASAQTADRPSTGEGASGSQVKAAGGNQPVVVTASTGRPASRRRVATTTGKRGGGLLWLASAIVAVMAIGGWWLATGGEWRFRAAPKETQLAEASPNGADPPTPGGSEAETDTPLRPPVDIPVVDDTSADRDEPPPVTQVEPDDPPEPSQVAAVREALTAARRAMADRDLSAAAGRLDQAEMAAGHPTLAEQVARCRTLLHYVEGFWHAVDESIAGLAAGQELVWREKRTIVVEANPPRFALRIEGVNRTFRKQQLPADLAVLLAQRWLVEDEPNSPVFTAAFLSVDPDGDPERARAMYHSARAAGVEAVDDLLGVLDSVD